MADNDYKAFIVEGEARESLIIEVLREEYEELKEQLEGISRDDFSEVYYFKGWISNSGNGWI